MMLLLALCCMTLTAGAQRVLTLDECHQLALKNNKKLKDLHAQQQERPTAE